jgi:hypothetical protein
MEHFDAIGKWRDTDFGAAINAKIELAGRTVDSPKAFREALLAQGNGAFVRTVIEKLMTYATGRGIGHDDAPIVRQLGRDLARDNYRWSSLIVGIVKSAPFQMRGVSTTAPHTTTVAQP